MRKGVKTYKPQELQLCKWTHKDKLHLFSTFYIYGLCFNVLILYFNLYFNQLYFCLKSCATITQTIIYCQSTFTSPLDAAEKPCDHYDGWMRSFRFAKQTVPLPKLKK